jgi:hypothetical protein
LAFVNEKFDIPQAQMNIHLYFDIPQAKRKILVKIFDIPQDQMIKF